MTWDGSVKQFNEIRERTKGQAIFSADCIKIIKIVKGQIKVKVIERKK